MAPLIAGIISTLIQSNLPKVAQAVVDKGLDYVEEKTGMKLEPDMSAEKITELRQAAMQYEEFQVKQANENTADARDMNTKIQESQNASWLSKNTAYLLDVFILFSTIAVSLVAFFVGVPMENKELVYMALGSLLTMTGTIINFHRGSSSGSAAKQNTIDRIMTK